MGGQAAGEWGQTASLEDAGDLHAHVVDVDVGLGLGTRAVIVVHRHYCVYRVVEFVALLLVGLGPHVLLYLVQLTLDFVDITEAIIVLEVLFVGRRC